MPSGKWITFSAACLLSAAVWAQQQDFSKVEIKTEKVADHIYMLVGAGGNIGLLVGPDGAVIIDDQFAPLTPKIQAAIGKLTDEPVRFVLNTHFHGDHTGGNEAFGKAGSVIIAHDNTRERLSTHQVNDFFKSKTPPSPKEALPVVTFAQSMSLHLNGEDIDATHLPSAHTDTDIVLYFRRANVMHTGDVFPGQSYPFIDVGAGGSLDGVIAGMATILKLAREDTKIIPGHAPLATRAQAQAYHDMLVAVRQRISDAISQGKSEDEVVASQPTKEFDAQYGGGFMTPEIWVRRAYADLQRGRTS